MSENLDDMMNNVPQPQLSFGNTMVTPDAETVVKESVKAAEVFTQKPDKIQEPAAGGTEEEKMHLTPQEQKQIDAFVNQIDITDSAAVLNYGVATQKNLTDFSENALESVRTKDMGEVGDMLTDLMVQLKNFNVEENEGGLKGFFHRKKNQLESLRARYSKVETNVDEVSSQLEQHQIRLMKDSEVLDRMYALNLSYYKELMMYIIAGRQKLEKVRSGELADAQKKAQQTGLPEDAQAARDLAAQCDRFEKKIYDLELTRTIAMQTAPQIRMLQASDMQMAEKIQSTIINTIPLWKSQMVIAVGMEHATEASKAEREVNDMTNELLKKNADKLHQVTVETARENERGIVDIDTLKHTNEQLISAMDEIITIQKDGRQKRQEAEAELQGIEKELHDKLLEASRS